MLQLSVLARSARRKVTGDRDQHQPNAPEAAPEVTAAGIPANLTSQAHAGRIDSDIDSADSSGVSGTPTFFINGRRHYGAYDITALTEAAPQTPEAEVRPGAGG
ncbi:DsbA family protein [Micromonospora parva]|uniref:DsbA family protein n=1 Tax=Micromonospora parva TaxID=1464048 RepID=UPI00381DB895